MIKTLPMNEVSKKVANIYEAAIIIAKRARQINNEQKQMISRESELGDDDYDNYIDDEDGEITAKEFINLPKPSELSMEEFMQGTLKFGYGDSEEEEEEEQMDSK